MAFSDVFEKSNKKIYFKFDMKLYGFFLEIHIGSYSTRILIESTRVLGLYGVCDISDHPPQKSGKFHFSKFVCLLLTIQFLDKCVIFLHFLRFCVQNTQFGCCCCCFSHWVQNWSSLVENLVRCCGDGLCVCVRMRINNVRPTCFLVSTERIFILYN